MSIVPSLTSCLQEPGVTLPIWDTLMWKFTAKNSYEPMEDTLVKIEARLASDAKDTFNLFDPVNEWWTGEKVWVDSLELDKRAGKDHVARMGALLHHYPLLRLCARQRPPPKSSNYLVCPSDHASVCFRLWTEKHGTVFSDGSSDDRVKSVNAIFDPFPENTKFTQEYLSTEDGQRDFVQRMDELHQDLVGCKKKLQRDWKYNQDGSGIVEEIEDFDSYATMISCVKASGIALATLTAATLAYRFIKSQSDS